jgi:hypothetical protein
MDTKNTATPRPQSTALNFAALYCVLHAPKPYGLSGRAAAFVAGKLLVQHGIAEYKGPSKAGEHEKEHGPQGSRAAQTALQELQRYSLPLLLEWLRHASECQKTRAAVVQAEYNAEHAALVMSLWLKYPESADQREARESAASEEWWQREGKYECELEERGGAKYYHHERDRAWSEGRDLTAREFLAGETTEEEDGE